MEVNWDDAGTIGADLELAPRRMLFVDNGERNHCFTGSSEN